MLRYFVTALVTSSSNLKIIILFGLRLVSCQIVNTREGSIKRHIKEEHEKNLVFETCMKYTKIRGKINNFGIFIS